MPKIRKANRVLTIDEASLPVYLKAGYDEIDEKGEVVNRATGGRTVSLAEYNKVLKELEGLKGENKKLKAENTKLKKAE